MYKFTLYILMLAITYLAFTPLNFPVTEINNMDKINHIGAFAVLAFFQASHIKDRPFFQIAIFFSIYGLFIKIVQHFLPNRLFSIADFLADLLGITLAYFLLRLLKKYKPTLF